MTLYAAILALMALMLQAAPAAQAPAPAPKASVAGVVVNANGEPVPNIRVALGRLDVSLGPFAQMIGGDRPPREMTLTAEALGLIGEEITAAAQAGASPDANVSAAAFNALSGLDIHEIIVSPAGGIVVVSKTTPPVLTDERGRFAFNDVTPGRYKLMFSGNGYAKQDYGQRTSSSASGGVPMTLAPGQAKTDIVMRMVPVSAVSGRVRDAAGQPVAGVPVQLFRFVYDQAGQRKVERVTSVRTDDRGEYRMYYLTPGRYYLGAGHQPGPEQQAFGVGLDALLFGGGYFTTNRIPQNYAVMYYPGVGDENAAAPIDVQPGADLRGLDLLVAPQQPYRVRGRVVDARTGQPPPTASISINVQNPDPLTGGFVSAGNTNYKAADGTFELQNISAGAYTISASIPNAPQQRPIVDIATLSPAEQQAYFEAQRATDLARPKASAAVKVVNADVDGVILTLGLASSLSGRVRMESNVAGAEPLQFTRIQLKGGAGSSTDPNGGPMQQRPTTADGTFRIDNVWPGEYRIVVGGMPEGFYVKEARLGDTDILNGPLRLNGPDSRPLDIVFSSSVGAIEGVVADSAGQPLPGSQVVLIPSRNRDRAELFRPATADLSGRFTIPSIAPGEYTLAAWEALEPNAFFDPNSIRQAEAGGKAVRVTESSTQTVNLTAIPLR